MTIQAASVTARASGGHHVGIGWRMSGMVVIPSGFAYLNPCRGRASKVVEFSVKHYLIVG